VPVKVEKDEHEMKMRAICMLILLLPVMSPAQQSSGEIQTLKVQRNVYILTGAGANIAVQMGDTGSWLSIQVLRKWAIRLLPP
jgi:hypothetical protein